jgi:hypothetical protein
MSATPRDLLKPRAQRLAEVYQSLQHQAAQSNSQIVTFGCVLAPGGTNTQLAISAGKYVLGQSEIDFPAVTGQLLTGLGLTNTAAGQTCIVLVEADATQPTPVLTLTQSAIATGGAAAVAPAPNTGRIVLGRLAIPASFTFGTTALTGPMCVTEPYYSSTVSPVGGF